MKFSDDILVVRDVALHFGGITALDGVGFSLPRGAILGLIGPNGAGKTTLFNCLSRLYTPDSGDIRFEGRSILGLPPHAIPALGIGRTFQNLALFESLSVFDNILVGAHARDKARLVPGRAGARKAAPGPLTTSLSSWRRALTGSLSDVLGLGRVREREAGLWEMVRELMADLGIEGVAQAPVSTLPFGTRKRVELARALASGPSLLLLDEPAGGLNHDEVFALGDLIARIRDQRRVSVLLVEHHMRLVMGLSDKVVVMDFGRRIGQGTPAEVQRNPEVIRAYLGN
uniref:Amino acid/amide ABC transporter ATP-binding protein 1, HAAT family n=1 Tax=Candidatus Kentrum sp. DK TaxID=2126562 RepID=A0A450SU48_9GAMM|nr:MAG: amino acid/amide ABC transporter ATP-binding protein 1, HAAT family [Candidatus Kentron sp. DK]